MRNRVILDLEKKGYKVNEGATSDDSISILIGNVAQQMNQNKLKRILVKDAKNSIDKAENNVVNFFYDAGESIDGFMIDKFALITPTVRVVRQEADKSVSGDINAINGGLDLIPECRFLV